MHPEKKDILSAILLVLCAAGSVLADTTYPLIKELNRSDIFFKQLTMDINHYYMDKESGSKLPTLLIYRYITTKGDSLFTISASLNISYEALVTLNRLERPEKFPPGKVLLLPNLPGIFINKNPKTDLEYIISSWRKIPKGAQQITTNYPEESSFYFLPGKKFNNVERSFFLGVMFRFPVPKGVITSYFGPRKSPFTGKNEFHEGVDIAAPGGTKVLSARGGRIEDTGQNAICGNYILILHDSGFETKYCHLKKIFVTLHQKVRSGMIIGEVGTTGMSTGPHLHFEIRERGKPQDPLLMMPDRQ